MPEIVTWVMSIIVAVIFNFQIILAVAPIIIILFWLLDKWRHPR